MAITSIAFFICKQQVVYGNGESLGKDVIAIII